MNIKDYPKSDIELVIDEWIINNLNCDRNRSIIKDRLFQGYTIDFIAEKYDLSETQVKNVIKDCRRIILNHLV